MRFLCIGYKGSKLIVKLPRIFHRIWAFMNVYFWLPCPLCGKYFGGHEIYDSFAQSIMTNHHSGKTVCPDCVLEAKSQRERFMTLNPPRSCYYTDGTVEEV